MKEKEYTYKQDVDTLRLMLDFSKFKDNEDIRKAYNILQLKGRKKAAYITEAINYYDTLIVKDSELDALNAKVSLIGFLGNYYSLKTKEDITNLLEDKAKVNTTLVAKIPEDKEPTKTLCGFTKEEPEYEAMHERLFKMTVNNRIFLITKAILRYVESGQDYNTQVIQAFQFLRTTMNEYEKNPEKRDSIVNNLYAYLKAGNKITTNIKYTEKYREDVVELLSIFMSDEEIENILY